MCRATSWTLASPQGYFHATQGASMSMARITDARTHSARESKLRFASFYSLTPFELWCTSSTSSSLQLPYTSSRSRTSSKASLSVMDMSRHSSSLLSLQSSISSSEQSWGLSLCHWGSSHLDSSRSWYRLSSSMWLTNLSQVWLSQASFLWLYSLPSSVWHLLYSSSLSNHARTPFSELTHHLDRFWDSIFLDFCITFCSDVGNLSLSQDTEEASYPHTRTL